MSRQADEVKSKKATINDTSKRNSLPNFLTAELTAHERMYLNENEGEWPDVVQQLEHWTVSGLTVKLSRTPDGNGLSVVLREKKSNWKDEKSVTSHAATLEKAVVKLSYWMARYYPAWPNSNEEASDW